LVLEYAIGGDLHSYVNTRGPLEELAVRFIIGEVGTALVSLHALGFVFLDLKPENVLITATSHLKLTDFGGARALSEEAKSQVQCSKGVLAELRNGDWKDDPQGNKAFLANENLHDESTDMFIDDDRLATFIFN
jgi:serine/threonine protein kinase